MPQKLREFNLSAMGYIAYMGLRGMIYERCLESGSFDMVETG